jgi:predicted nucleic acid-binding protein
VHVAVDTSVLVALFNPRDVWHFKALALQDAMLASDVTPMYFDCVAAETISTIARRLREKGRAAEVPDVVARLETLVRQDLFTWILPDVPRLYSAVLDLIRASSGELNFNDALIALACRERGIPAIASFDADFDQVVWLKRLASSTDLSEALNPEQH